MITNSTLFNWTLRATENITGVHADCIITGVRTPKVCNARIIVFYFLHSFGWPAQRMTSFFRGMDGKEISVSTVTHGILRARKIKQYKASFRQDLIKINDEITACKTALSAPSIKFNINNCVKVKLTPHGEFCLRVNYEESAKNWGKMKPDPFILPEADEDGFIQLQMHVLIAQFGKHLFPGCCLPFDPNIELLPDQFFPKS